MKRLRNQNGQFAIEGILLTVLLLACFLALTKLMKSSGLIPKLVTDPWSKVAGMAEFGSWNDPTDTNRALHPISNNRAFSRIQPGATNE